MSAPHAEPVAGGSRSVPAAQREPAPTSRARSFSLRRLRSRSATEPPSRASEADRPPVPSLSSSHDAAAEAASRAPVAPVPPAFPAASAEKYAACYCEENVYRLCAELGIELARRNAVARASGDSQRWDAWAVVVSSIDQRAMLWRQRASSDPYGRVMWDYHVFLVVGCTRRRTGSAHAGDLRESQVLPPEDATSPPLARKSYQSSFFRRSVPSLRGSGSAAAAASPPAPPPTVQADSGPPAAPVTETFSWVYDYDSTLAGPQETPHAVPLAHYLQETFRPELMDTPATAATLRPLLRVVPASLFLRFFSSDRSHMRARVRQANGEEADVWAMPPPPWDIVAGPDARAEGDLHGLWTHYVDMQAQGDARYGSVYTLAAVEGHGFHQALRPGKTLLNLARTPVASPPSQARRPRVPAPSEASPSLPLSEILPRHGLSPGSDGSPRRSPAPESDGAAAGGIRRGGRITHPLFPAYAAAALEHRAGRARGSYLGLGIATSPPDTLEHIGKAT